MLWRFAATVFVVGFSLWLNGCTSCGQQKSPDEIRRQTANATATLKRDTVAVARGVKDGMLRPGTVDINTASKSQLMSLPGVTDAAAASIIRHRPYDNPDQLVTRRAISTEEYDKIKDRVAAKK